MRTLTRPFGREAVRVAIGRQSYGEIIDLLTEEIEENRGPDLMGEIPGPHLLREYIDRAFAGHLRVQRSWPARTEVDRLERAGQALAALGICYFEALECCDGCLAEDGGRARLGRLAVR